MCLLLETIKISNGKIYNIEYHNKRFNSARKDLFGIFDNIDLGNFIKVNNFENNIIKCRIIYSEKIHRVTYENYKKRKIQSLKLIFNNDINYKYKYFDRSVLNKLLEQKNKCDDILIVKNNFITDTSFSNIIFFDGKNYITPVNALLNGTKRQALLDQGIIIQDQIHYKDLKKFEYALLINSMLDINDNIIIKIENIYNP